jgi:hypothetical protein
MLTRLHPEIYRRASQSSGKLIGTLRWIGKKTDPRGGIDRLTVYTERNSLLID